MTKSKHRTKAVKEAWQQVKAQRCDVAPWLCLPRWCDWQHTRTPAPKWIATDCGLVSDPRKRAVWEPHGAEGFLLWQGIMVAASRVSTLGLMWGDLRLLQRELQMAELPDIEWLLEAGWLVYVTDSQKAVLEGGGTFEQMLEAVAADAAGEAADELHSRMELFGAIAGLLTDRYGEPHKSRRSEALYWVPSGKARGRDVRLALHAGRRLNKTICNIVIGHECSDIAVPFPEPVSVEWVVAEIDRWVAADTAPKGTAAARSARKETHSGADKGGGSAPCAQETDPDARSKPHLGTATGDLGVCAQKQDNTRQDSTVKNKTKDRDKLSAGPQSARPSAGLVPEKTGQDNTTPDGTGPDRIGTKPVRQTHQTPPKPANPHEPEAGGGSRSRGPKRSRRAAPTSIADSIKLVWCDDDAKAFGEMVFRIIWPGRDVGSDDAKSEIACFGMVWITEVKCRFASTMLETLRTKARAKARHVKKNIRGCKSPGAVFVDLFRKSIGKMAKRGDA